VVAVRYRRGRTADIPLLARHHRAMFAEMRGRAGLSLQGSCCAPVNGGGTPDFERLEQAQADKLQTQLADNTCLAWLAETGNTAIGSGCLSLLCTTPVPEDPSCRVGFLHSLFVEQTMRHQGVGGRLVALLLDEAREQGIRRVQLAASEAGRPLYEQMGFVALDHMVKWL